MDLTSIPYKLEQKTKHIAKLQTLENTTIIKIQMKPFEKHSLLAVEDTDLLVFQIMP